MIIPHTIWQEISDALAERYKHYYYTPERHDNTNPMEFLTVRQDITKFFGTKTLSLFIIGKPYGWEKNEDDEWEDHWPPEGLEDAINHHIEVYEKFSIYRTLIWIDFIIVQKIMESNPDSRIQEMMEAVEGHISDMCSTLADYGLQYMGRIEEGVEMNFFTPYIDEFLALITG